ncbi:Rab protein geranylgeranyltransferase component A [Acrasis kona]|uniref:Rab escort protein 1 n=1 Tax=Acrasis kona TaxID=1008807 RepID=A0AAW2YZ22_9EUKA
MAEHLPNDQYDVIISSTGLVQSLLAGALCRVEKKVLHLDMNDRYGGQQSTLNLEEFHQFISRGQHSTDQSNHEKKEGATSLTYQDAYKILHFDYKKKTTTQEDTSEQNTFRRSDLPNDMDEALVSQSRRFAIDLTSQLLFSNGEIVQLLISSAVGRYLEFKCIDAIMVYVPEQIKKGQKPPETLNYRFEKVPLTKGDIMKNTFVSLPEKSYLVKFITSCMDYESQPEFQKYQNEPFIEYLRAKNLSPLLCSFIIYAIAMLQDEKSVNARDGMSRVKLFISSLGRYGSTPFLYPLFGSAELNQAFCRVAAVYGATYVLRRGVENVVHDVNENVTGIECTQGQLLKCSSGFVLDRDYCASNVVVSECNSIVRQVLISDSALFDPNQITGKENSLGCAVVAYIPPGSFGNDQKYCVTVMQVDQTSSCAPKGKFLISLQIKRDQGDSDEQVLSLLKTISTRLFESKNIVFDDVVAYQAVYRQLIRSGNCGLPAFENLFVCDDADGSLDYGYLVSRAKNVFEKLTKGQDFEFLPKMPNPDGEDDQRVDETSRLLGLGLEEQSAKLDQEEVVESKDETNEQITEEQETKQD